MVVAAAAVAAAATIGTAAISSASQSKASREASQTQAAASDAAVQLQREQFEQTRADLAPWREAGAWALPRLQQMIRQGPGQPFQAPRGLDPRQYTFVPPTAATLQQDPGFQFRLQTGMQALEGTAAARGGLLSGGALRGALDLGQQMGSQEYGAAYGRALGQNELRYGRALTANQDQYNRALQQWQLGQGLRETQYNRLAGLSGTGQTTSQYLGGLGANYAANAGELALQRGNVLAAGQIGSANAWGNFANTTANTLGSLAGMYMHRPAPPPGQVGYGYNPTSVPYDPWEFA
jgi:hypothetical protein